MKGHLPLSYMCGLSYYLCSDFSQAKLLSKIVRESDFYEKQVYFNLKKNAF